MAAAVEVIGYPLHVAFAEFHAGIALLMEGSKGLAAIGFEADIAEGASTIRLREAAGT
jgi:hypothetical protein